MADSIGVTIALTTTIETDIFSLLSVLACVILISSAWALSQWFVVVDVLMMLFVMIEYVGSYLHLSTTAHMTFTSFLLTSAPLLTITPSFALPLCFPLSSLLCWNKKIKTWKHIGRVRVIKEYVILLVLSAVGCMFLLSLLNLHTRPFLFFSVVFVVVVGNVVCLFLHKRKRGTRKMNADEVDFEVLKNERRRSVIEVLRRGQEKLKKERKEKRR